MTNIFKCNRQDYIRVLDDVYTECDESKVKDIEILFYYRIKDANMEIGSFETYPWFEGVQGATLRNYSGKGLERFIRNVCAKLKIFQLNSRASRIIAIIMKLRKIKSY